ncbi:MAG: zinc ribbon domain-containing protein [Actinomycetes bacterium]
MAGVRCPDCGAHNPESAPFCTQCFRSFAAPPPPPPPPAPAVELDLDVELVAGPDTDPTAPPAAGTDAAPAGRQDAEPELLGDGRFRRGPEGLDWACGRCGTWTPMERTTCPGCGARFGSELVGDGEPPLRTDVPPVAALVASALLPGAGHVLLGRPVAGIGRALLYVLWLVGGVLLLQGAAASEASLLPAMPLVAGAFVLLFGSVYDAHLLTSGSTQQVLGSRTLLWLVVGVVGLTTIAFLGAALSLPGVAGG